MIIMIRATAALKLIFSLIFFTNPWFSPPLPTAYSVPIVDTTTSFADSPAITDTVILQSNPKGLNIGLIAFPIVPK